jgi:hypothetical protein
MSRRKLPVGVLVWEGASLFDGSPIAVIASGLRYKSENRKTGPMVQVHILRSDVAPFLALKTGKDQSICGDCKLRPQDGAKRACYVRVWPHEESIYDAYRRGVYIPISDVDPTIFKGRSIRLGAYGDPAAVPVTVWKEILKDASGWTAYTHAWKTCNPELKALAMASVDSEEERLEARAAGWRTFRTRLSTEALTKNEIACPASPEAGSKSQCDSCQLCDGDAEARKGKQDRRASIAIVAHGSGAVWFSNSRARTVQTRLPIVE